VSGDQLTILVPAFNEEEGLPGALAALRNEPRLAGATVVVINDGSTDKTADVARAHGAQVVVHKNNRGYGAGIKSGTRVAETPFVAWFDADGQHRAQDLADVFELCVREGYDAVLGNRGAGSHVVKSRVVGKQVLGLVASSVVGEGVPDLNCGLRVFRTEILLHYLPLLPDGFSASTTTTLLLYKRNRHFTFHSIVTEARKGKSTVKQVRDGLRTLHLMFRILVLFTAFKFFSLIAAAFLAVGLGYGSYVAVTHGQGFPVLAAMTALVGVIIFCFGIVSDQISTLRLEMLDSAQHQQLPRRGSK
jgi:glycosyltransferase involved in cell wall biosynthesis